MAIDMTQFYQVFFEESMEHLANMENLLLHLDIDHPDAEQVNAIFRAAHSIKGSASTFGFSDIAATTHILEGVLDRVRKGELRLTREMVDAVLACGDVLQAMLGAHQGRGSVPESDIEAGRERLRQFSFVQGEDAPPPGSEPRALSATDGTPKNYDIEFVSSDASAKGGGVANLLDDLRQLGDLEILQQPAAGVDQAGFWHLRLSTAVDRDDLLDRIDFVAESDALRVAARENEGDFGFFDDSPGLPEDVQGYGFFEPLVPAAGAPSPESVNGNGVAEEGEGYGFFEPLSLLPRKAGESAGNASAAGREKPVSVKRNSRQAVAGDSSIRVSVEKVDQLINLVGELVITQSMLLQSVSMLEGAAPERLLHGLMQLERNTRDLQDSVLSIRMMPISLVFSRFPRLVRDLSAKLGKQVELKTSGEGTELDKGLVERIVDPLTHLIRNSLDHGIETPEKRAALGKSPVGTVSLKASHQGGSIVIEVGDNGAGLDRDRILAKARERGLPVSDQMSDSEVFSLIFEPGFSTAEAVTDLSGRGVGMDVVRRNIHEMGGRVEIDSMAGVGTRVTVRLPLTLAILDGMSVGVGDQTYIMPLTQVVESFQPKPGDIRTISNQGRVIQVREDYLPIVALHEIFNLKSQWGDFAQGIIVVVAADGIKAALFVDALLGQHQVVVKNLEANYRRVPGVSGATIMGDGRVALILDLPAIAGMVRGNGSGQHAIGSKEE